MGVEMANFRLRVLSPLDSDTRDFTVFANKNIPFRKKINLRDGWVTRVLSFFFSTLPLFASLGSCSILLFRLILLVPMSRSCPSSLESHQNRTDSLDVALY